MHIRLRMVNGLFACLLLSGCGELFETPEYTYCGGGSSQCCQLTDTRTNAVKHFCTTADKCVAENQYQSVHFPASPGKGVCNAQKKAEALTQTQFAKVVFPKRILESLRQKTMRVELVAADPSLTCTYQCDVSSPLCNNVAVPLNYGDKLQKLAALFRPQQDVRKADVMTIFEQTEDQCDREDILVSEARFSNRGVSERCIAVGEFDVGGNDQDNVKTFVIDIPQFVGGRLIVDSYDIGAIFDSGSEPVLLFDNDPNSIYSGALSEITTHKNAIVASVGGSCLFMSQGAAQ